MDFGKNKGIFGKEVIIRSFDKLKYQTFLRPNDRFDIQLKWDSSKIEWHFNYLPIMKLAVLD